MLSRSEEHVRGERRALSNPSALPPRSDRLRAGRRAGSVNHPSATKPTSEDHAALMERLAKLGISVPSLVMTTTDYGVPSAAWAFRCLEPAQKRGTSPDHRAHRGRGHTAGRGPARAWLPSAPSSTTMTMSTTLTRRSRPTHAGFGLDWACWRASALAKPSTSSSRRRRRSGDPYRALRRCSQPRFCSPSEKNSNEMTCSLTSNAQATTERRSSKTRGRPPYAARSWTSGRLASAAPCAQTSLATTSRPNFAPLTRSLSAKVRRA